MDILYIGKRKTSICGTGICHVENEGSVKVAEVPIVLLSTSSFLLAPARTARFTRRPRISGLLPQMTSLACLLLMHSFVARAAPLQGLTPIQEGGNGQTQEGEQPRDRTIFTVISMICMMVVAFLLGRHSHFCYTDRSLTATTGSRSGKLRRSIVVKRSLMSTLVVILYMLVVMFIICSAVLAAGQGLYTRALCVAGTWTCLMFYTFIKGIMWVY